MTTGETTRVGPLAGLFLGYGLRPFFLFAGLYAAFAMVASLLLFATGTEAPARFSTPAWHAHEMLFGYVVAVITGFLLTAVPSWTNTPILPRPQLAALVVVWIAGRAAMWGGAYLPIAVVAAIDLAYLLLLTGLVAVPILRRGNRRNYVFIAVLLLLVASNAMTHLEVAGGGTDTARTGLVLAVDSVVLLLVMIGGRIIPAFTANALHQRGSDRAVRERSPLDRLAIISIPVLLLADLIFPESPWSGFAGLAAGILQAVRMIGWRGTKCLDQPILWVLHLGYAWVAVGLLLKGVADLGFLLSPFEALHGVTAGAIGTMTLGVMSRAALGHTGRPLVASRATTAAYVLVSLGALARIFASSVLPSYYIEFVVAAGLLWAIAFTLFSAVYWPILTQPRPDGRPG
jgi:uncharacterized protein involved in response to NO